MGGSTAADKCGQRFRITAKNRIMGRLCGKIVRIRPQNNGADKCGQRFRITAKNRIMGRLYGKIVRICPHWPQQALLRAALLMRR
jgi:hypothetical protein